MRGGGEGCGEAVLGQGGLVLATRSVGGSDMIPSHASSGMEGTRKPRVALVRSRFVSHVDCPPDHCRGLKPVRGHGAEKGRRRERSERAHARRPGQMRLFQARCSVVPADSVCSPRGPEDGQKEKGSWQGCGWIAN